MGIDDQLDTDQGVPYDDGEPRATDTDPVGDAASDLSESSPDTESASSDDGWDGSADDDRLDALADTVDTESSDDDSAQSLADDSAQSLVDDLVQRKIRNQVSARLFNRKPKVDRIGRFAVLRRIGAGGMGTVYSAYDEQLDRKVAVKIINARNATDTAQLRLKREAQAMARLSHPNVITVHEVGEVDGKVFVAMEFIHGDSLDAWIRTHPGWREVLEVFIQAGRGIDATHHAGLVHRDLKPHNIMRAEDGSVKVLDFGLARTEGDPTPSPEPAELGLDESGTAFDDPLTRTGALVGTPAYMAPEIIRGTPADPRSDQFGFCVALFEALYRCPPFEAPSLPELLKNVLEHRLRPAPASTGVPAWVHRIVVRGLSLEPRHRWPSMLALVDALGRDPARARRRWAAVIGIAGVTGLAGFAVAGLRAPGPEPCPSAQTEQQALWPSARRDRVAQAFEATGSPLATDAFERVATRAQAHVEELTTMRVTACEDHRSGRQSDRVFDLRTACLDARRAGLHELLTEFEHATESTIDGAVWATAQLPSTAACSDTEALTAAVPPPRDADAARQVQIQREALASASALVLAGSYEQATARAHEARSEAETIGYPPLIAEAELMLGTALMQSPEHASAERALSRSIAVALQAGHDEVAVEALARRMWVVADPLRRPAEALWNEPFAEALLDKLDRPVALEWLLLNNRGVAQFRAGRMLDAEASYRAAIQALDQDDVRARLVDRISSRFNLAMLLSTGLGRPGAAADELRSAHADTVELLGPRHPRVALMAVRLAASLVDAGRATRASEVIATGIEHLHPSNTYFHVLLLLERANLQIQRRQDAQALQTAQQVLPLIEAEFADQYLHTVALWSRGLAQVGLGRVDAGLADLQAAVDEEVERSGADSEFVANARWWHAHGLRRAGQLESAAAEYERARETFGGLGPSAPALLGQQSPALVGTYLALGDTARADLRIVETIRAQDEAGFGEDNQYRMMIVKLQGDRQMAAGQPTRAVLSYERACRSFAKTFESTDPELAECRLAHARALGRAPGARPLVRQALAAYEALGEGFAAERAQATALLAQLP